MKPTLTMEPLHPFFSRRVVAVRVPARPCAAELPREATSRNGLRVAPRPLPAWKPVCPNPCPSFSCSCSCDLVGNCSSQSLKRHSRLPPLSCLRACRSQFHLRRKRFRHTGHSNFRSGSSSGNTAKISRRVPSDSSRSKSANSSSFSGPPSESLISAS